MSDAWDRLEREFDAWSAAGRAVQVWWRDDDATTPGPALTRLLDLAAARRVPLALAVIPDGAGAALAERLRDHAADTNVLQHGYAHKNRAGPGAKKCELVSPAARPAVLDELSRGRESLDRLFAARFRPVLVPPWNRLANDLMAQLPGLGFVGLSCYTARASAAPVPGLVQVNCHLDLLRWRPERGFLGTQEALGLLCEHLAAKRQGRADAAEPSGILSHHKVHDAAAWSFLDRLLACLAAHPAVRLLRADAVFAAPPGTATPREAAR